MEEAPRHKTLHELILSNHIVNTYTSIFQQRTRRLFVEDYHAEVDLDLNHFMDEERHLEHPIVQEYQPCRNPYAGFQNLINDSSDNKDLPERRESSVESFRIIIKNNRDFESDSAESISSNSSDFTKKDSFKEEKQDEVEKIQEEVVLPKQREQREHRVLKSFGKNTKEAKNPKQTKTNKESTGPNLTRQEKIQKLRETGCNCKKTNCLKMYCECFHLQIFCGSNCSCKGCGNLHKTVYHDQAVIEALTRNPKAFQEENPESCFKLNVGLSDVKKGCKCKKTRCLKKYCECYNGGEKCGIFCKCEGCENIEKTSVVEMEIEG